MLTSAVEIQIPNVENVTVTEDTLTVELGDGRTLSVPLAWFPRLLHAAPQERDNWRLIGKGHGIHWEDLDEDISVEGLLAGKPSGESQTSFKRWLEGRTPDRQKEIELFYLKKFLHLLGKVPKEIRPMEPPNPDFIVILNGKKIGVELTEYHSNSTGENQLPRRAIEKEWELLQIAIMEEVQKYSNLRKTNGLLFFRKLGLPKKSERKKFIEELINFSLAMIKDGIKENHPGIEYPILNKYLRKIFSEECECYINWGWNHDAASVGLSEDELLNAIKDKLLTDYTSKDIDELWLLIYSSHRLSSAMGINLSDKLKEFKELNNKLKNSQFNKVFIYQFMFDDIYEWPEWKRYRNAP